MCALHPEAREGLPGRPVGWHQTLTGPTKPHPVSRKCSKVCALCHGEAEGYIVSNVLHTAGSRPWQTPGPGQVCWAPPVVRPPGPGSLRTVVASRAYTRPSVRAEWLRPGAHESRG